MSENRFVDNGDGTVTDTFTQLMWMQKDSYLDLLRFVTHKGSLKYMNKKNWREQLIKVAFLSELDKDKLTNLKKSLEL